MTTALAVALQPDPQATQAGGLSLLSDTTDNKSLTKTPNPKWHITRTTLATL